jgi:hypothetical protein
MLTNENVLGHRHRALPRFDGESRILLDVSLKCDEKLKCGGR